MTHGPTFKELFENVFNTRPLVEPHWLVIQTPPGHQEMAAILNPLPPGPYIHCRQGAEVPNSWDMAAQLYSPENQLELAWGTEVYAQSLDGGLRLVGYWRDTSG